MSALLGAMIGKGGEEYIESDGIAYVKLVDTGTQFNITKIKAKFQTFDESLNQNNKYVFGRNYASGLYTYKYGIFTSYYNGYKFGIYSGFSAGNKAPAEVFDNTNDVHQIVSGVFSPMTIDDKHICFGYNADAYGSINNARKIRLWYLEFFYNNIALARYKPKYNNGEAGLFDEVNNKFYGNFAGAGQLILGRG